MTLVRSVLKETLPVAAALAGGEAWAGGSGRGKGGAHCGTGFGAFEIKGLAARVYFAFIHSSLSAPAVAPASAAPMARRARGRRGAGERRAGTSGTGWAVGASMTRADRVHGPTTGFTRLPWCRAGQACTRTKTDQICPDERNRPDARCQDQSR